MLDDVTRSEPISVVISAPIRERFPGITVAGFVASGLDDLDLTGTRWLRNEEIAEALDREGFPTTDITSDPRIAQWREAVRASGLKASKFRGSAEQLVRRVLAGTLPSTGDLVDLYCRVSARHVAPLGAWDLDALPGRTIELRESRPGDRFSPLGAEEGSMPLDGAVPVYAIGELIGCWMFNVRDSEKVALHSGTRRAIFMTESLDEVQWEASRRALEELRTLLQTAGARLTEPITA